MSDFLAAIYWGLVVVLFGLRYGNVDALCAAKTSCSFCIQDPDCDWCFEPVKYGSVHCFNASTEQSLCPDQQSYSFVPQIRPQFVPNQSFEPTLITLVVRIKTEYYLNVSYTQPKNSPLDLYYLMDLSATMARHVAHVAELGTSLGTLLTNLTSDFQIGYGSFVDKAVLPFFEAVNFNWYQTHCQKNENQSAACIRATYSFENHLSLTRNLTQFVDSVRSVRMSGNIDAPEGTLDALTQVILCRDRIGWRNQSRRIVVVLTDDIYHVAGDGKVAGLVEPFVEQCFDAENIGSSTVNMVRYDYPSVHQINRIVSKHDVHVIFAVTRDVSFEYHLLSMDINGSDVATLKDNSSDVLDIIYDFYSKLTRTLTVSYDTVVKPIQLDVTLRCPNQNATTAKVCDNVQFGDRLRMHITVKLTKCLPKPELRWIMFENAQELFLLNVSSHCRCDCAGGLNTTSALKANRACSMPGTGQKCSNAGTCKCGKCVCDKLHFGRYCEKVKPLKGFTCQQLEPCFVCFAAGQQNCLRTCPKFALFRRSDALVAFEQTNYTVCSFVNKTSGCSRRFFYDSDLAVMTIDVRNVCLDDVNNGLSMRIALIILTIGLGTIIVWKVVVKIYDSREYAKFVHERNHVVFGNELNPIFKEPINNFQNPLFQNQQSSESHG